MRQEYHQQAAECVRLAEKSEDHVGRLTYVALARAWLGLADLAEKNEQIHLIYDKTSAPLHAD